ncbi:MAG: GNAT family N-acetyltransferase [Acidimicrobiia bacterium]
MDVRLATPEDAGAICAFGAAFIPEHYGPLLGAEAAKAQVTLWWTPERLALAAREGRMIVAEVEGELVGVGEWGIHDGVPVVWKLYVHPSHRQRGIGPRLLSAIVDTLPDGTEWLRVEHFVSNRRAGQFYEREGFTELGTIEDPTSPAMSVVWRELSLSESRPS